MPSAHPCATPRSILITGASSGLGAALARAYAAPGVTLFLGGRDEARLAAVAGECRAAGATTEVQVGDVTAAPALAGWIVACDRVAPLDLVIANAGISAGTGGIVEGDAQTRTLFAVNGDGVVNTVLPAIELMRPRRRGQIALVSSLAGFRGLGGAPAYCATKAMVRVWGEGLRGALAGDGVGVSVICPGFVATPMTDRNRFPMPWRWSAERAAVHIRRELARGRGRIAFPAPLAALAWLAAALPDALIDRIGRWLPAKDAAE